MPTCHYYPHYSYCCSYCYPYCYSYCIHDRHPISWESGSAAQILDVVVSNEAIHHIEPGEVPFGETGSPPEG